MDVLTACHQALVADLWAAVVSLAPAPTPAVVKSYGDYEPVHVVCDCNPEWSLCDEWLGPDDGEDEPQGVDCLVCADMALHPCPECGEL